MALNDLMTNPGAAVYYEDGFRNMLEDHLSFLRTHPETTVLEVTPMQAHRYEFDMTGLLNLLGVKPHMHWVVMRVNRFVSPQQVPADLSMLLLPAESRINILQSVYSTTKNTQ